MSSNTGFFRLSRLLSAGYHFAGASDDEAVVLEHSTHPGPGRRLLIYPDGTLVGAAKLRISADDRQGFAAFLQADRS